jgi:hypothetical protein
MNLTKKFTILITGSRDWDNYKSIQHRILETVSDWLEDNPGYRNKPLHEWLTVVHGGCPKGADRLADVFARNILKCKVIVYPADWKKFGKRAGPLRNLQMVQKSDASVCLGFIKDNSSGAKGCMKVAKAHGLPIEPFHYIDECELWPIPDKDKK